MLTTFTESTYFTKQVDILMSKNQVLCIIIIIGVLNNTKHNIP